VPDLPLVVRRRALDDVAEIADWIALDNPGAAERFEEAFAKDCRRLTEFPAIGRSVAHAGRELRGLRYRAISGFESWLLFYRARRDALEIVRVVHGARDLRRALRS